MINYIIQFLYTKSRSQYLERIFNTNSRGQFLERTFNNLKKHYWYFLIMFFFIFNLYYLNNYYCISFTREWFSWKEIPLWPSDAKEAIGAEFIKECEQNFENLWNQKLKKTFNFDKNSKLEMKIIHDICLHIWCKEWYWTVKVNPHISVRIFFDHLIVEYSQIWKLVIQLDDLKKANNWKLWDKIWSDIENHYKGRFNNQLIKKK